MNKGLRLWQNAKKIIPGGNGLLSKRPERFSPLSWPTYYSSANGFKITDLDNNLYYDLSNMGVGASILGYADRDVDKFVKTSIGKGVNTSLNSPLEPELAKQILQTYKSNGSVRFARSGGEAMQIAIRIARAFTKKELILFSGYHGWTDWYLAANISSSNNLDEHLLPGLNPLGVPKALKNTVISCRFNDAIQLKKILKKYKNKIAAIVFEGARNDLPSNDFIRVIKEFKKTNKFLTISDEITSGFRFCYGGAYNLVNSNPDIAVYGKGLGNGYAISAIVGKYQVMDKAQDSFISSSFWTESVGFAAGIATLKKIKKNKTWKHLDLMGNYLKEKINETAQSKGILLTTSNLNPIISIKFNYKKLNDSVITYVTNEMLKRNFLFSNVIFLSAAHNTKVIDLFINNLKDVFNELNIQLNKKSLNETIKNMPRSDAFIRLT